VTRGKKIVEHQFYLLGETQTYHWELKNIKFILFHNKKQKGLAFAGESHQIINSLTCGIKIPSTIILVTKIQDVKSVPRVKICCSYAEEFLLFHFLHTINVLCTHPLSKITVVMSVEQNQENPVSDIRAKKKQ
jgi:hypothetical protein